MTFSENSLEIKSWVKGVEISLNPIKLAKIFNFPPGGYRPSSMSEPSDFMTPLEQMRLLTENPDLDHIPPMKTYELPARSRLLSRIVSHTLLPKSGHFDEARWLEYCVICHLLLGRPFDLGFLMITYIRDTYSINIKGTKKFKHLPYGLFFSVIFAEAQIDLLDTHESSSLKATNFFNLNTIQNMGFEVQGGILILSDKSEMRKKRRLDTRTEQQAEEEEIEHLAAGGSSTQPPRRVLGLSAQISALTATMERFMGTVTTRFDSLDTAIATRFDSLDTAVAAQGETLDDFGTRLSRLESSYTRRTSLMEQSIEALRRSVQGEDGDEGGEDEEDEEDDDEGGEDEEDEEDNDDDQD